MSRAVCHSLCPSPLQKAGGCKWKLGADHTVFIVHSFTNVQNKNQTIKEKTFKWELLLAASFFPGSSACPGWIMQQSHATVPITEPLFLRCQVSHQQDVALAECGLCLPGWTLILSFCWINTRIPLACPVGRGCPLCLTAEVRLRYVLAEAMSVLIHKILEFQNGLSWKEV